MSGVSRLCQLAWHAMGPGHAQSLLGPEQVGLKHLGLDDPLLSGVILLVLEALRSRLVSWVCSAALHQQRTCLFYHAPLQTVPSNKESLLCLAQNLKQCKIGLVILWLSDITH